MSYFLFLLVTATLFIRPAEIVPSLYALPIYEYLIVACLVVTLPGVLAQISSESLRDNPVTACVVGLLFAVVLSHLSHFFLWGARTSGWAFSKTVLYYLLLVAVIDSPERLRSFLRWLLLMIAVLAALALLSWHGLMEVPAITALKEAAINRQTGEEIFIGRLRSTGIFNDPNDLAMILAVGVSIALYFLTDPEAGIFRPVYAALAAMFAYAAYLTQSRGGLLALVTALLTFFWARWGWKRTALLAAVALPLLLVAFKGRMTSFDEGIGEGTGQSRVQLWSEGLGMFRQSPLFGIGCGEYSEESSTHQVAHNSFVHCFTELGFFGGALFLGAFGTALVTLYRLRTGGGSPQPSSFIPDPSPFILHPSSTRMLTCIIAVVASAGVAMLSLSRSYVVPTYLVLGLATAGARVVTARTYQPPLRFNSALVKHLAVAGVAFLAVTYVFVRVAVRWS